MNGQYRGQGPVNGQMFAAGIAVFSDGACQKVVGVIARPAWDAHQAGINFCITQSGNGGPWGSVRYNI